MKIQKSKIVLYFLNLLVLTGFFVLLIYSLLDRKLMYKFFSDGSYYIIFLVFILWVVHTLFFLKSINFSLKGVLQKYWPGIVTALAMTVFVFISVDVTFKTLSDETNLLSVSNSMLSDKSVLNTTMAKSYYGNLNPINREIEKRPLMFSFLTNLVHTLSGFRYQNAFALNFIILFLLLAGIYILVRKCSDAATSAAGIFLIISYPVVTIFATSGGFDLLNSTFFIILLAGSCYFIKNPSSAAFSFIFATLLMFSNMRYESIIFLAALPVFLLWKLKWQYFKDYSFLFFITPLLTLPYIWQRLLRTDVYQNPAGVPVFSFTSLLKNLNIFFTHLIDLKYFLPYAGYLTIIGILISIYLLIEILRRKILLTNHQYYSLFVLTMSILLSTGIFFSHFFGDYTHPSSARFFITLSIVLALAPVGLKILKPNIISGNLLLVLSVMCFFFYNPIAVEGRFINSLVGNRTNNHCLKVLSKINDKNILIIAERPGQFTALGYGTVNFSYANKNAAQILNEEKRRLFSKIIVFQEIRYKENAPTPQTTLDSNFKLKSLYEIQISATVFLKISEVQI